MTMATTAELEVQLLQMPIADRARLLFKTWESLADDPQAAGDPEIDPAGLQMAMDRDAEIDSGEVAPLDDVEFRRRTGADG